jgi:para-aminobenzoate synthetase/4-amino-4-deoxychorismate lyase
VFKALFPCGSVTGAPKIRTMQIIDELEIGNREVYCGAIGLIAPEKTVFSVPIRILQKKNNEGFFLCRVGGAIVWDSDILDEWKETLVKIKFLSSGEDFELVETIKVENAELIYGVEHFERLKKSAEALGFEFNDDLLKIKPEKDGILRILLSKNGDFKTQYLPLEDAKTNRVTVSENKIDSKQSLLRHKTTHRPWYESSVKKIRDGVIYDEIFFNEKNELTEGARSNVVVEIGGKLFTPPIESGLLNGILRSRMIAQGTLFEKKISKDELFSSENVYCINSVRGVKKVEIV